jgi:hypothetical protein
MLYRVVLTLNAAWFTAGFCYFGLMPYAAAKLIIPRSARQSPLFITQAGSLRFLGGLNFAFAVFAVLLLRYQHLFQDFRQDQLFAAVFSVAHATQFAANLPVAFAGGRKGAALWPVLRFPMLMIFVVDFALAAANATSAIIR